MHKAFVSSTFEDLREHRRHVVEALRRAGFHVDPMEDWTAAADAPLRFSRERVAGCDLCVLLVALRRGHVPSGERDSITQQEYAAARDLGIDVLVFLLDENAPWPRSHDELDADPELRRWRSQLMGDHGVGFFQTAPDSVDIAPALARWLQQRSGSPEAEQPAGGRAARYAAFSDHLDAAPASQRLAARGAYTRRWLEQSQLTVADLKRLLGLVGYFDGDVDDEFDSALEDAVLLFQHRNGLHPVDGICGGQCLAKLRLQVLEAGHDWPG